MAPWHRESWWQQPIAFFAPTARARPGRARTRRVRGRPSSELNTGAFAKYLESHREELLELFKIRGALDELAAEEAALSGSEGLARIAEASEASRLTTEAQGQGFERPAALDVAFHVSIAQ